MWVITTDGFYSVVQDRGEVGKVLVRARAREDLELIFAKERIIATPKADYPFRVRATKNEWARLMERAAREIDYDNFKNAVELVDKERAHVYLGVWSHLMAIEREQDFWPGQERFMEPSEL